MIKERGAIMSLIIKIVLRSVFLIIAAEPSIDVFKRLRLLCVQFRKTEEKSERKELINKILFHSIGLLFIFAVYCLVVAVFI